jgi:hypothetical protein
VLANRLSDATLLSTELFEVFYSILRSKRDIADAALADIRAVRERVRAFAHRCAAAAASASPLACWLLSLSSASCAAWAGACVLCGGPLARAKLLC